MRLRQGGQARVSGDERSTVGRRVRSDALAGGGGGGGGAEANPGGLRSDNVRRLACCRFQRKEANKKDKTKRQRVLQVHSTSEKRRETAKRDRKRQTP